MMDKYKANKLRLALQYRRAGVPEQLWFNDYPNQHLVDKASLHIDNGQWLAVYSKDVIAQFEFIAEILKFRPQDKPKFVDFGSLLLQFVGRYTKYDALDDGTDFRLIGIAGIRRSGYYKLHVEDFLTYLYKAFGKQGASIILGFQQVDESRMLSVYGAEMVEFLESTKFTHLKI